MNSAKERIGFNRVNCKEEGKGRMQRRSRSCSLLQRQPLAPGMVGKEAGRKLEGARIGELWARLRCMAGGAVWGSNGVNRSRRRCLEVVGLLG